MTTDLLSPSEPIEPVAHKMNFGKDGPLPNWPVYHPAFPLEQALDPARYLEYLGERMAAAWREGGAHAVAGKLRRYLGKLAE